MSVPLETPAPDFGHLLSMTDERGTFEHALFSEPSPEHGYCTDDMARVLVVATRESGNAIGDAQPRDAQLEISSGRIGLAGQVSKSNEPSRCLGRSPCTR